MDDKTKKLIAREGLTFIVSIILAFLVDNTIVAYVPRADTPTNHIKTIAIIAICFYIPLCLLIHFIIWVINTLKKK